MYSDIAGCNALVWKKLVSFICFVCVLIYFCFFANVWNKFLFSDV
jgi:hypothetical protein